MTLLFSSLDDTFTFNYSLALTFIGRWYFYRWHFHFPVTLSLLFTCDMCTLIYRWQSPSLSGFVSSTPNLATLLFEYSAQWYVSWMTIHLTKHVKSRSWKLELASTQKVLSPHWVTKSIVRVCCASGNVFISSGWVMLIQMLSGLKVWKLSSQ